ncbi:MAG: riboflavin synthase [Actinobacteria bacterium]|nr:riboflavin synthase [Actinomycetota bacterium]
MFTGIVEERGIVHRGGPGLEVASRTVAADSGPGASVAVNGACLTVVDRTPEADALVLRFDVSSETLSRTTLGSLREGAQVNLERPVTLLTRLGGHLVQGHVDGVGRAVSFERTGTGATVVIDAPQRLARYMVEKGSVAVDGVSLTVATVRGQRFEVALVPFTLEATTLGGICPRDRVNLEADLMAKYVESLMRRAE